MNFSRKIVVGLILLSGVSAASVQALSLNAPQTKSNQVHFDSKKGEQLFLKAQELFFMKMYSQALIELEAATKNTNDQGRLELISFYQTICNSFMIKQSAVSYLEDFLQKDISYTYNNIIKAILGEAYLQSGDVSQALEAFKNVDKNSLSKSMLQRYNFYYGKAFFESGQYPEAKYRLSLADKQKSSYSEEILYYLSYIKYHEKDYQGALQGFGKLSSNSKYAQAQIFIAQIKFHNGDFKYIIDNRNDLEKMAKGESETELQRLVGESYYNLGQYSQAIESLNNYFKKGATPTPEQYYILGYSYYMNNLYQEAIKNFTKIIDGSSEMVQNAYYHLADSYLKTEDRSGALRAFSMASSMTYNEDVAHDALYNHVKLSYEMGGGDLYSQIIELMQRFLQKYPTSQYANEIRGYLLSVYINTSDYQNALSAIKLVSNPSTQIVSALQRMCYESAIALYQNGEYAKAIDLFKETIKYNASPKYNALSRFWQAESLIKMGRYDKEAENLYKSYMQLSTKDVRENKLSHYNLAYIYFNNKDWNQSIDWFTRFLDLYPTSDSYRSDALSRVADIYFGKKEYAKAIEYYSKAVSTLPQNADYPQYQIAITNGLTGKIDRKIEKLKEIVDSKNSVYSDMAIVELAATYNRENRFKEGDQLLKSFVETQKESPYYLSALLEIAVSNVNIGNNDQALDYYKRIVLSAPSSSQSNDALLAIKSLYISKGDVSPYFAFIKSAGRDSEVDNSEKEQITFDAITQQYLNNQSKGVIHSAVSYRKEFPNGLHNIDVTYYLAESLLKTENKKEALKELETIIAIASNKYLESALNMASNLYAENLDRKNQYRCVEMIYNISTEESTRQKSLQNMMELSLAMGDAELIAASSEKVFADANASKDALSYAYYAKALESFEKQDYVSAFSALKKSSIALTKAEGANSEYMKAVILFNDKKYDDTETLILNFAKKGTPHQFYLAKSFLLLGDVYVARKDLFQAKATYQSIVDGYGKNTDGIIDTAKSKIALLNSVQTNE